MFKNKFLIFILSDKSDILLVFKYPIIIIRNTISLAGKPNKNDNNGGTLELADDLPILKQDTDEKLDGTEINDNELEDELNICELAYSVDKESIGYEIIEKEIKVPVYKAESPLTCVAEGTGKILENLP